jgi:hypothetical protein
MVRSIWKLKVKDVLLVLWPRLGVATMQGEGWFVHPGAVVSSLMEPVESALMHKVAERCSSLGIEHRGVMQERGAKPSQVRRAVDLREDFVSKATDKMYRSM